jgi:predicted metal-binding membrane protein
LTRAAPPRKNRGPMSAALPREPAGAAPTYAAARAHAGLVALLLALAAGAWWLTADRMAGMDDGPGTDLGTLGWFLGVWVVMMAAMMLPSVAPTTALYARMARLKGSGTPLAFAAGYLLVWGAAGLLAYLLIALGDALAGDALAWQQGGRWLAGGTLLVAAAYELTAVKDACLSKCRSPLAFLLTGWRDRTSGALSMGARHGGWCLGCCWALMASLFALGVMSLAWMACFAAVVALEKLLPWRRVPYAVAAFLAVLGIALLALPDAVPWLTIPMGMGG